MRNRDKRDEEEGYSRTLCFKCDEPLTTSNNLLVFLTQRDFLLIACDTITDVNFDEIVE